MITARQYRDEPDDDRMTALVGHIDALTGPRMYCTLGELDWWRFTDDDPQIARQPQLWFDTDQALIGFAWAGGWQVDPAVHPDHTIVDDRLRALGADTACVATGSDDSAANGLYDAVEMPVVARNLAWAKQLDV